MGWTVQLTFDREGQQQFDALAQRLVGQQPPRNAVALVVDGAVESSPAFQSTSFPDGVQVSGNFTKREAEALAAALDSGPYPVAVNFRRA